MPPTVSQLQDMGLTASGQVTNDESLIYSDWDRKLILHEAIKASDQTDKPKGEDLWATQKVQFLIQPHATWASTLPGSRLSSL